MPSYIKNSAESKNTLLHIYVLSPHRTGTNLVIAVLTRAVVRGVVAVQVGLGVHGASGRGAELVGGGRWPQARRGHEGVALTLAEAAHVVLGVVIVVAAVVVAAAVVVVGQAGYVATGGVGDGVQRWVIE